MIIALLESLIDGFFACLPRARPDKKSANQACLIAHRGAHKKAIIENTDAAFARALALGCWGIEFDVHATADGVLVVNHDPNLIRLWGKDVAIREQSFKALRGLVPEIPTLLEVVERYGKQMHLFIELKAPFNAEAQLKNDLQLLIPGEDYHLLSLDASLCASLTTFSPETMLLVAVHNNLSQYCQESVLKSYGGVLGHYFLLSRHKINQLKRAKKAVGIGFVDSKFGLYRELNRGLLWIFSNNVELLSHYLRELRKF